MVYQLPSGKVRHDYVEVASNEVAAWFDHDAFQRERTQVLVRDFRRWDIPGHRTMFVEKGVDPLPLSQIISNALGSDVHGYAAARRASRDPRRVGPVRKRIAESKALDPKDWSLALAAKANWPKVEWKLGGIIRCNGDTASERMDVSISIRFKVYGNPRAKHARFDADYGLCRRWLYTWA